MDGRGKLIFVIFIFLIVSMIPRNLFAQPAKRGVRIVPKLESSLNSFYQNDYSEKPEVFVQLGHPLVNSAVFSPDGRYVASVGFDLSVKLWEVPTGRLLRTIIGHSDSVLSVAFSPDGKHVISGSDDKTIRLWEVSSGKEVRTFAGVSEMVFAVTFSPDGRYALSGGSSFLRLWEVSTGKEVRKFRFRRIIQPPIFEIAFSPDGRYALSDGGGGTDNVVRLWDVSAGEEIKILTQHSDRVRSVAFSPDGKYALSGSADKTIKLYQISTGKERVLRGHSAGVASAAFSPDGKHVISGSDDKTIRLWEVSSGKEVRRFSGHSRAVSFVAFSPDGRYVVSGGHPGNEDKALRLWEVSTGEEVKAFKGGRSASVYGVAYSPDSKYALSAVGRNEPILWEVSSGRMVRTFEGHSSWVRSVAFSPDGKYALSGSEDKTLKLWDVFTGREIKTLRGHSDRVKQVSFSPNRRHALSVGDNCGEIHIWDLSTGYELKKWKKSKDCLREGIGEAAFSPDGKYIFDLTSSALELNTTFGLYDTYKYNEVKRFKQKGEDRIAHLAISPNGKFVLAATGGDLVLLDVSTGKEVRRFKGHLGPAWTVTFSADGVYGISGGGTDGTLRLWEISTSRELWKVTLGTWLHSVACSPDGKYVLSGGADGTTRIWDISSGEEIARFISLERKEWVVITQAGYFNASKNGTDFINVRMGNNVYGLDQFYDVFYRPDIVELALKGEDISKIAPINLADALKNPPPGIEFLTTPTDTSEPKVIVKYKVTSTGGGIGDIRIFHNGKLIQSDGFYREAKRLTPEKTLLASYNGEAIKSQLRSIAVKDKMDIIPIESKPKGQVYEGTVIVEAVPGENEIGVAAFNQNNTVQSMLKTVAFNCLTKAGEPHLYILAIGIDRYKESSADLKYAVKDTDDIQNRLRNQSLTLFKSQNIHTIVLKNDEATKANILQKIEELSKVIKPYDHFILYVAAHGVLKQGLYSIVTQDYDGQLSESNIINSNEIMDISKKIRSLNQLLVLDTCHAGGLDSFLSGLYDARMTVLARNMGLHMYASASSKEEAMDGYKDNGMFTYTLLDGLNNNRKVDKNSDQEVSVEELGGFAKKSTIRLSAERGHRQNPLIINFGKDVPVYLLR